MGSIPWRLRCSRSIPWAKSATAFASSEPGAASAAPSSSAIWRRVASSRSSTKTPMEDRSAGISVWASQPPLAKA
jgi:hypothetical protein